MVSAFFKILDHHALVGITWSCARRRGDTLVCCAPWCCNQNDPPRLPSTHCVN